MPGHDLGAEALSRELVHQGATNAGVGAYLLSDRGVHVRLIPRVNGNIAVETRVEPKNVAAEHVASCVARAHIGDTHRTRNVGDAVPHLVAER